MNKLRILVEYAQRHGVKTAVFAGVVMVWDQDGGTAVTNLKQLREWLGY